MGSCYNKSMNSFSAQIKDLEKTKGITYEIRTGKCPVMIVAAHGIGQKRRNGHYKLAEPYTRGIAKYVSKKADCYCLTKNEDTGVDPNKKNDDEFKAILLDLVKKNNIKLMVDLHGAKREREFDVEIGTRNGEMVKSEEVDRLIDCFKECGIRRIVLDDPFKGGQISQTVHEKAGIDCVQLEINYNYRNVRKIKNLREICRALTRFVSER